MVRVMLRFDREISKEPITSQIIIQHQTPINIISARITPLGGEMLAELDPKNADKIIRAFRDRGVVVDVNSIIEKDDEQCIDCGACVSVCPSSALNFTEDHSVKLDPDNCTGVTCGLCLDSCPRRALHLI
jgi:L-aspartate semialdehyde sulfurtransferase ferredoxin